MPLMRPGVLAAIAYSPARGALIDVWNEAVAVAGSIVAKDMLAVNVEYRVIEPFSDATKDAMALALCTALAFTTASGTGTMLMLTSLLRELSDNSKF
jgi:hypothetical protein